MVNPNGSVPMGTAALIAGLTLFIPTAPYAEFFVFGKLIVHNNAAKTMQNLSQHPKLFLSGIFAILFTFILDVICAWAIYIFLRPVNSSLSLLAAWFRLVSVVLAAVALFNYVYAFQLLNNSDSNEILELVNARRVGMHVAYIMFGIYLIIVGALILKSTYIPKVLGALLIIAGLAWNVGSVLPYFMKGYQPAWLIYLTIGEFFWMLWLLVKGRKMKEQLIKT